MKSWHKLCLAGICCAVLAGLILKMNRADAVREAGPMTCEFYVWQRTWAAPVCEAVTAVPEWVGGLAPLGAEVAWRRDGPPEVAWPDLDFAAIRRAGRRTGAVLRVGQREPSELQVDFDCAESQLDGYRSWLDALRLAVAPVPVRPTALPSWLEHRAFAALARESGGYILQVHATERPRADAPETALCEAARAKAWVERAGRIGVPFRVALPTYTYLVAFAPDGKVLGIEAEGEARVWPRGTVVRAFRPDAAQFAGLMNGWLKDRPACLTGVLWYRLPVATDTLNWRWPTLAAVTAGRAPRRELRVEKSGASPVDIALVNAGETEEPLPAEVVVTGGETEADADGVGGYRAETRGREVVFRRMPGLESARLAPGVRHPLGWLRKASETDIHVR